MAGDTDQDLIRVYARNRSEEAFGELVHRYVDLVYSTAVRVLRDACLAEDVSQRVFMALAQHAVRLQDRAALTGWLHETARNIAITTIRSEERRRLREQEAITMNTSDSSDTEFLWKQIAPHLDDALAQLNGGDREMILWRYFERKTAGQIGEQLGLSGDAAQKRIVRALDRLRTILSERGLTVSAAGLASLLPAQAIQSAPAGLAASAIAASSGVGASFTTTSTLQIIMASTKAKIGIAALVAASVTTPLILQHQRTSRLGDELAALQLQAAELDRLRGEVQRLTTEAQLSENQRVKEGAELTRLRGELTALRSRESKLAGATQNATPATPVQPADASKADEVAIIRAEDVRNVGFQTPSSTLQTLHWAKTHGDTNVVFNALAWADENSRAGIEAVFASAPESVRARYGSADAYILSLFDHSGPQGDRHTLTLFRILEERITGDEVILNIESHWADGSSHTHPQRYVRIGNDWRQALNFDAPEVGKISTTLQAEGQVAE